MSSPDQLVYDMSMMPSNSPSVFVRKDWISILDNMNGNYQGNSCVIDTSQLANSNKYMNYREAYLSVPLIMSMVGPISPNTASTSGDFALGLKNSYATLIHSITVEMNGVTIIQQTPNQSLWSTFKLLTSLSYQDLIVNGPTMGFYPDSSTSWSSSITTVSTDGTIGQSNNRNQFNFPTVTTTSSGNPYNEGFAKRQTYWNFNPTGYFNQGNQLSTLLSTTSLNTLQKSYIFHTVDRTSTTINDGCFQAQILAQIKLKHLCDFFDKMPLMKGTFFKITLTLNQPSIDFGTDGTDYTTAIVSVPSGGINPLMITSQNANEGGYNSFYSGTVTASLNVGKNVINNTISQNKNSISSSLSQSITLNIPAYTFNPIFETAYLSNPIKTIQYEDIYHYQVLNIPAGTQFQNLVSNGIAGIKSVLMIPFYAASSTYLANNSAVNPLQSPFDSAGGGTTSPLAMIGNWNIQISGQNVLYNSYTYNYQTFMNQLYGVNSVNGGLEDGLMSGLISQQDFENNYCYYYADCSRSLEVEKMIPKSVNVIGQNLTTQPISLYIFVSYSCSISCDILSGARC